MEFVVGLPMLPRSRRLVPRSDYWPALGSGRGPKAIVTRGRPPHWIPV